ncbi:Txe/YoeB family addiction module toxin [Pararhizobium antarcticum]|uniref:Putative mRNA interferase YoeB n=1 Tax=Pararhizobium antarcticum TaxID=1798805 RepID=A0A657LTL5_9HYPH|nr:Txe/YoeB family addiction module toxin [Pararhizobium antarcticum]OJF95535.1 toxin YoeB [Rhizobium sp. 58]OJF96884.1 toxin YoeB [Pararhizobium antarcticum]
MLLVWHQSAWDDYFYWQQTDKAVQLRINELIKDLMRHPFGGLGKPEPLLQNFKGYWSRRITQEHRLIYVVSGEGERQTVTMTQCRFHH